MKKYKSLIIGSLMAVLIVSAPIASFAQDNEKNYSNSIPNSIWNRLSNFFTNRVSADSKVKVPKVVSPAVTTAPVISNIVATSTKTHQAVITWTTDVKASTQVWYSKTSPVNTSIKANVLRKAQTLNHSIKLNRLLPNTKYYIIVGSNDSVGKTLSSEISFVTPVAKTKKDNVTSPSADITAPVITSLMTNAGATTSTITWNTNEHSTSKVFYSTSTPIDINNSATPSITNGNLVTKHSLNITGLAPSTLYHFIVKSLDASNNSTVSSESSFVTTF